MIVQPGTQIMAMIDADVNRFVRFVSLDTHPAHNKLVVTYDIFVSVLDRNSKRELTRRSKRDQLLISLSQLDQLKPDELRHPDKLAIKLSQLSEQITSKCPLLLDNNRHHIEDIQLHLLYLVNRKRLPSSANDPGENNDNSAISHHRPPSSASLRRLKSSGNSSLDQATGRPNSRIALSRPSSSLMVRPASNLDVGDVYLAFRLREEINDSLDNSRNEDDIDDLFLTQMELYLDMCQQENEELNSCLTNELKSIDQQITGHLGVSNLETQLEGLYGDARERQLSIAVVRKLISENNNLISMSSNSLLICALLRVLRDSSSSINSLNGLSILYCLIRLTKFQDIYTKTFERDSSESAIDLPRIVIGLFNEHVSSLIRDESSNLMRENFYLTNSLLIVIDNLFSNIKTSKQTKLKLSQHINLFKLANTTTSLFELLSKHLPRDIRHSVGQRYERLLVTQSRLTSILWSLTHYKEFINQLRSKANIRRLIDSLISILNTLQMSRPGSANNSDENELNIVRDLSTLNEIYELELKLLQLIGNLLYDFKFRTRMIRKNLVLKCILRNLVLFLASRKSTSLKPFNKSLVLIIPFKCLYELSCRNLVKIELFKSKIIIKCLLEYLLISGKDLASYLDDAISLARDDPRRSNESYSSTGTLLTNLLPAEGEQILLDGDDVCHYIVALWLNLSATSWASLYETSNLANNIQQIESIWFYIDLTCGNLNKFVKLQQLASDRSSVNKATMLPYNDKIHLIVYIHLKLIRNFTQFLNKIQANKVWFDYCNSWMQDLSKLADKFLASIKQEGFGILLAVECIATLKNLIDTMKSSADSVSDIKQTHWIDSATSLIEHLAAINFGAADHSENDDLLMASINLIGSMTKSFEICPLIDRIQFKLIEVCNFVFETKTTDSELLISCLYTCSQLLNHSIFLNTFSSNLITAQTVVGNSQIFEQFIDQLSSLLMHDDLMVNKLANFILNHLKQVEESQALAESLICEKRFIQLNGKWLQAIGAQQRSDSPNQETLEYQGFVEDSVGDNDRASDEDADDLNQLRTFQSENELTKRRHPVDNRKSDRKFATLKSGVMSNEIEEDEEEANEEEDEDVESLCSSSEPDLNVIDANSMIGHLTGRREFRFDDETTK